jgi:hypothetical protein
MAKGPKGQAIAQIRSVERILRDWDPIGVQPGVAAPADEYDSYAPHIVSLVRSGCTACMLTVHLESLCVEVMGLGLSTEASRSRSQECASRILVELQPSNMRWSGP